MPESTPTKFFANFGRDAWREVKDARKVPADLLLPGYDKFDLVLHRQVDKTGKAIRGRWLVSERRTGTVVSGMADSTPQQALTAAYNRLTNVTPEQMQDAIDKGENHVGLSPAYGEGAKPVKVRHGVSTTELGHAAQIFGHLPKNALIEHKPGVWGFAGSVASELAYESKDGTPATAEQLANARSFGPALAGVRSKTWPTREAAIAAAKAIGQEVTEPVKPEETKPTQGGQEESRGAHSAEVAGSTPAPATKELTYIQKQNAIMKHSET